MISLFLPHSLIGQTAAEFSPFPKLPASSPPPTPTTAGKGKLYEKDLIALYESYEVPVYESIATVGESRVWWRADFQSGSRVLKKVF